MQVRVFNWRLSLDRVFVTEQRLAEMYDDSASGWEQSIDRMGYQDAYARLASTCFANNMFSDISEGANVLDGGIGTGALSNAFMPYFREANLTGIDISSAMLANAHANIEADTQLKQASITALPFADNTFDMVMSAHVVEHLSNPAEGIRELLRVLKPNKPFVLVATRRCLVTTFLSLKWNFSPILKMNAIRWLRQAGAATVTVEDLSGHAKMSYMSLVYSGYKQA